MKLLEQLISCVFTYIFSILGVYVWNIGTPIKWVGLIPLLLAVVAYFKFSLSLILSTPNNIISKNWLFISAQLLFICLNIFILVYVINNLVV